MNVEIGTEAAQFPKKEYINGIFVAVYLRLSSLEVHEMKKSAVGKNANMKILKLLH